MAINQFYHLFTAVYKAEIIHYIYLPVLLLIFIIPGFILHILLAILFLGWETSLIQWAVFKILCLQLKLFSNTGL